MPRIQRFRMPTTITKPPTFFEKEAALRYDIARRFGLKRGKYEQIFMCPPARDAYSAGLQELTGIKSRAGR